MIKKIALSVSIPAALFAGVCAAASLSAHGQMPAPILNERVESSEPTVAEWKAATPQLRDAFECQTRLDLSDEDVKKVIFPEDQGYWLLMPPRGFTVYDLPVQAVKMSIDSEDVGNRTRETTQYASVIVMPKAMVEEHFKKRGLNMDTGLGMLTLKAGSRPTHTELTCTVITTKSNND